MLITGILEDHLATTDQQAKKMFFQLVEQMTKLEGVTEQLKTYSQLEWIQCMNNIKNRAMEIVNTELITI
jgi:Ni,Fe-hydrogenase I cytochrome b subunit